MGINPPSKRLSICIPTYNRSKYLDRCLSILVPQAQKLPNDVEIIVSDNCSNDDTGEVVARYSQDGLVRYSKNESNIGGCKNIQKCFSTLAEGEFCWVIGDDDILRDGSIAKVVQIIRDNPDIDYIHVNFIFDTASEETRIQAFQGTLTDPSKMGMLGIKNLKERKIDQWEDLLADDMFSLNGLYTGISRLALVRDEFRGIRIGRDFENIESTYPHTVSYIRKLVGRKAYTTGVPWVICGTKCSWTKFDLVARMRSYQLILYQRQTAIPPLIIDRQLVRFIDRDYSEVIIALLKSKTYKRDVAFADEFSLIDLFTELSRFKPFRRLLTNYVKRKMNN